MTSTNPRGSEDDGKTDQETETDGTISRRRLLQNSGMAGIALSGGAGIASAENAVAGAAKKAAERGAAKYRSRGQVLAAYAKHAQETLDILEDEGYLETGSIGELVTDVLPVTEANRDDIPQAPGTTLVSASLESGEDGGFVPSLETSVVRDGLQIDIHVLPEAERSYAVIQRPETGETTEPTIIDPARGGVV